MAITGFVLDCSMTMAWCFLDQASKRTHALRETLIESFALVPSIWPFEVANVLWANERSNKITLADSTRFKSLLTQLSIQVDEATLHQVFESVSDIAREQDITVYDASYLELAMRKGLPLATLDKQLIKAAQQVGVAVL